MKKILLGKGLEERIATCDFCGEYDKECIKGDAYTAYIPTEKKFMYVCNDYDVEFPIFGNTKEVVKGKLDRREVILKSEHKIIDYADICKDCIKQLAKLIS